MADQDVIEVILCFEHGSPGTDTDPTNPLPRATTSLLESGKPIEDISLCLYGNLPGGKLDQDLRWLGVFVLSAARRVIFFPGYSFSAQLIGSYKGSAPQPHPSLTIDHVSIEDDLRTWHFTSPGARKHYAGGKTLDLGDGRFIAFGMSIRGDDTLKVLKRETKITFATPPTDTDRRVKAFFDSQKAKWCCVSLHPNARSIFSEGFPHFAVIVGHKGFKPYESGQLNLPVGSPFLSRQFSPLELKGLPTRSHEKISLGMDIEVQVIAVWLPGSLTVPGVFTTLT
jgi:hypothetical protein